MPLIDLRTDLKSLKYGQDQPGGGNSGQPYIKVDINTVDRGFNRFRMTKFDDGLVRGGVVGAANASIVDTLRIGKFLTDFPKGPLFIVKQVGLQLSNPQLEFKKLRTDNPTSGGGLLRNVGNFIVNTANKIQNAVGPTRIYNLGINTLAQVPVNAFGQHIVRHGLLPVQNDDTKYINVAEYNNYGDGKNNRLVGYRSKFQLGDSNKSKNVIGAGIIQALGVLTRRNPLTPIKLAPEQLTISKYVSGPGSIYGIGNTLIRRYSFTEDGVKINFAKNRNYVKQHLPEVKLYQTFDYAISNLNQSVLSANRFNLKQDLSILSGSFQTRIASANDPKDSKYVAAQQEASASSRIKSFTAASNFSGSVLSTNRFPGLKDNTPPTLLNYTASNRDVTNSKYAATEQETSASIKMRTPGAFVGASNYSSSIFSTTKFSRLTSFDDPKYKPPTLDGYTSSINDTTTVNTIGKWGGSLTVSADLGLSEIAGITSSIDINQNVIPYTSATKKYSELRTQINKTSNIAQNFFKTDNTFRVNRGATNLKYVAEQLKNKFNRTNDIVVEDDTMALKFVPLDPFTGNALNTLSFLGYLTDYSEDYNSTWNPTKYVGRAESFYIFNEFKRTATVSFQIPCYNRVELVEKHCALSELASTLAGKYENNLLGGIITRLKIGNYINNQPGIITNLNFAPLQESNWDLDVQLAYYLKVSFGFTFIHDYLPQYYECGFILKEPTPEPQPAPKPTDPQPEETKPPPNQTTFISNDTGSLNAVGIVGRTDLREKIDNTFVKKPVIPIVQSGKFQGFGEGGYGGGGGGKSGRLW